MDRLRDRDSLGVRARHNVSTRLRARVRIGVTVALQSGHCE